MTARVAGWAVIATRRTRDRQSRQETPADSQHDRARYIPLERYTQHDRTSPQHPCSRRFLHRKGSVVCLSFEVCQDHESLTARVNASLTAKEIDRTRASIQRGRPYGEEKWVRETGKALGLVQTVRPEGRPRKSSHSATEAAS